MSNKLGHTHRIKNEYANYLTFLSLKLQLIHLFITFFQFTLQLKSQLHYVDINCVGVTVFRSECAWWLRCGDKQHVYTSCVQLYSTHCTHWTLSWSWGRASEVRFPSIIHPTVKFIFISGRRCALIERKNIVKLRQGSGKERQGMALKVKGLKA